MKPIFKYLTVLLLLFSVSCGTTKKLLGIKKKDKTETVIGSNRSENGRKNDRDGRDVSPAPGRTTYTNKIDRYIGTYSAIAMQEMELYKIPASITLAQGILESGAGEGDLTRRANNHFGIKCHDWKGARVYHDDDRAQECFRKYKDPKYSFRDHSLFLTERRRYAKLFELAPDDYKGWAKGLRAAGYATDRAYPSKLISIIERYQLYRYDAEVLGNTPIAFQKNIDLSETHVVKKGDTLYSIGKRYNISVEELKQLNGLPNSNIAIGQVLYVTPLTTNN